MKKFGEKFKEYKPLKIENIAIPDTDDEQEEKFFKGYNLDKDQFAEIRPIVTPFALTIPREKPSTFRVIGRNDLTTRLKEELDKVVVRIAPTANVYPISPDHKDIEEKIKITFSQFNYFVAELGLNVITGKKFKITELLFKVDLKCDSTNSVDVTAYDIAPDDKFRYVRVVRGKIGLGITNMLKFIPHPIAQAIPNLLNIEINPWIFDLGFNKYEIEAAGELDYKIYWKIYERNIVNNFNPTIILK